VEGYIYKVTNNLTGKSYVGQTVQVPHKRWSAHKYAAKTNKYKGSYFHSAIRKYGPSNFTFEIIDTFKLDDERGLGYVLNRFEVFYIKVYNTFKAGYNLTPGGGGIFGYKKTPEQVEKTASKIRGRKLSKEHKLQIGQDKSKPVIQYSLAGHKLSEYQSMKQANDVTGINFKSISNCCRGVAKTAFGFKWTYKNS
jgi:hypothetical protein